MLVRADALGGQAGTLPGTRTLAANPDSPERGDPWRWTVTLHEQATPPRITVAVDDSFIVLSQREYRSGDGTELTRAAGQQLVIAAVTGLTRVSAVDGPWQREIGPGDVFVLEGEDPELLRLDLDDRESSVEVITLAPRRTHALRWVP